MLRTPKDNCTDENKCTCLGTGIQVPLYLASPAGTTEALHKNAICARESPAAVIGFWAQQAPGRQVPLSASALTALFHDCMLFSESCFHSHFLSAVSTLVQVLLSPEACKNLLRSVCSSSSVLAVWSMMTSQEMPF